MLCKPFQMPKIMFVSSFRGTDSGKSFCFLHGCFFFRLVFQIFFIQVLFLQICIYSTRFSPDFCSPHFFSPNSFLQIIFSSYFIFFLSHFQIAFMLAKTMTVGDPAVSLGIFACGICPGGGASNMFCYLVDGDVSLSVTMTAISSIGALGN